MSRQALPAPAGCIGRQKVFPQSDRDDTAGFDFLANMNGDLCAKLGAGMQRQRLAGEVAQSPRHRG